MAFKRSIQTLSIAGTICLLAACAFYLLHGWFSNDAEYYYEQIERNLHRQIALAETEQDIILQQLAGKPEMPFSVLPVDLQHQYYIFRNRALWYWSDYHYVPNYESLAGNYHYRLLDLPEGQFVALKSEFSPTLSPNDHFEIFMLVPLTSRMVLEQNGTHYNRNIFISPDFTVGPAGVPEAGFPAGTGPAAGISAQVEPGSNNSAAGDPDTGMPEQDSLATVQETGTIYTPDGLALFEVSISKNYLSGPNHFRLLALVFFFLAACFWIIVLYRFSKRWLRQDNLFTHFTALIGGLVLLRAVMLYYGFPYSLYPLPLFDPQYYASSLSNPSLGDFLLNTLLFALISIFVLRAWLLRENEVKSWLHTKKGKTGWLFLLIVLHLGLLWVHYKVLHELFLHGQFTHDITSSLEVNGFKLTSWFIFILLTFIYILYNHILSICLNEVAPDLKHTLALYFGCVLVLLILGNWWPSLQFVGITLGVYFLVFIYIERNQVIRPYNYQLFVYVFMSGLISAFAGALAVYGYHQQNRLIVKERFATQILTDNDLIGEYLLSEAVREIKDDPYIKSRFFSPLFSKEGIEQKVRRQYLTRYFDRYDANILLFNVDGSVINHPNRYINYHNLLENAQDGNFRTDYPGLYLMNDPSPGASARRYQQFIPIMQGANKPLGYILIDLTQKRYLTNTIYPELFFGQRLQDPKTVRLNYAVYRNGYLEYNVGEFDYVHQLSPDIFDNPDLFRDGVEEEGYHHLGVRGQEGQLVVVSDVSEPVYLVFSNFSFLFLLSVLGVTLLGVWYVIYYRISIRKLDFTTKIQLYLNAAVFVPLLIVSGTTLSLINASFKENTESRYYDTAENISRNLSEVLEGRLYLTAREEEEISNTLAQMARYAEVDIHLFSTRGDLLATNQPVIYQHNYLAAYINPLALAEIREQNSRQIILTETVNNLRYRSAFMAVRSARNGALLGIISLPFFESGYQLERQLAAVFSNIVNIFACLFIIFLALLYLLSRELTDPLRYIAKKMKQVSLTGQNEPLDWSTSDELGMLVREYNSMLLNLQNSKEALSRSEKESAWREMAKQVAHEIKNPLTPMKLSLQHLNRMLKDQLSNEQEEERVEKTVKSLLDQIDTLSDIATSFSAFAKMPIPKQERFDIAAVLKGVVRLYSNQQHHIESHIEERPVWVLGDEQMMQRTFNNLILNGIQAVPDEQEAYIRVRLEVFGDRVLIEISDNGEGIDETIRDKVFVPNFSTKYTGSGLGLAIAKRGIEHAGGRIWFETRNGEGTIFYIELPLMQ